MWIPAGNGTTIIAIERRLRALGWGTILNGVGSQGNNPLLTSSVGAYRTLDPLQVHTTDHNQPLVNWHALQGPQALEAVARTDGSFHGVSDDDLCAAAVALSGIGARPTAAGAVAFAGLLNEARHGGLVKGTHIVLLSGRDITTPTQQSEARPFTETPESGHS
jgi:threonine synthase